MLLQPYKPQCFIDEIGIKISTSHKAGEDNVKNTSSTRPKL